MISNLDNHHEAWSTTLSDLKISPSEDVRVTIHRLENIAGFLHTDKGTNVNALLAEDVVIQGLNIFIRNTLRERILQVWSEVEDDKSVAEDLNRPIAKDTVVGLLNAFFALVTNFTSHDRSAESFLKFEGMIKDFKPLWFDSKYSRIFPLTAQSLNNLSAEEARRNLLLVKYPNVLKDALSTIKNLMNTSAQLELHIIFLANMTSTREARRLLLDPNDHEMFEDLFELLNPSRPTEIRRGIARIIKHLTADPVCHSYLLGETVSILPAILLPLAGNETFTDEEYASMPVELQYLEPSKNRDNDTEVRENLLAALFQLCRLRSCRTQIRNANTYLIMRELHKFETQETTVDLVERVVDLLIRTEDEIGPKGDFVDYPIPPLEQWIRGEWRHPED